MPNDSNRNGTGAPSAGAPVAFQAPKKRGRPRKIRPEAAAPPPQEGPSQAICQGSAVEKVESLLPPAEVLPAPSGESPKEVRQKTLVQRRLEREAEANAKRYRAAPGSWLEKRAGAEKVRTLKDWRRVHSGAERLVRMKILILEQEGDP